MPLSHEPPVPCEQVTRCLNYIHDWREHLAHAWVGRIGGTPDVRVIGDAVDDLISLALLVEKAGRTSPGSVAPLRDVIASSGARSVQNLWTAVGESASSPILADVFQMAGADKQVPVPDNVLNVPWVERIGEALNLMRPTEVPSAFFGDFHQLCLARPLEAAFFHFGTLETQRRRRDWGAHYTPTPIVEYLVRRTLGPQIDGGAAANGSHPRILDPSCGCGAFVITATQMLLRSGAVTNLSARERLEVIARAVFGTDIDKKAVWWTRRLLLLTVWASCVQDGLDVHDTATAKLPTLDLNIVCADFLRFARGPADSGEHRLPESFDVIIGGPPFVRLQDLHRTQPDRVQEYKRQFVTAGCGSFDLYMLFIEKSLCLLREGGRLGFSVSNSFLRSSSGRALRKLISESATVEEIVEFPDAQVYPDAKVQIALLCLSKGRKEFQTRSVQLCGADAVNRALSRLNSSREDKDPDIKVCSFSVRRLGAQPWSCAGAMSEADMAKIERAGVRLGRLPVEIRSGVSTGADKVFLLQSVRDGPDGSVLVRGREYGEVFHMESQALRHITRGRDIKAYVPPELTTLCIFPYDENGEPLTEQAFQERFPAAYGYLQGKRDRLIAAQRHTGDPWWVPQFRRLQANTSAPRLIAGKVGFGGNFTIDARKCILYHSTVAIVRPDPDAFSPYYLLGVLNSEVFWLFTQHRMPAIGPERYICRCLALRDFPLVSPKGSAKSTCGEIAVLAKKLCDSSLGARRRQAAQLQIDALAKALYGID
jgi:adenine-specific DNA-methyltransferase